MRGWLAFSWNDVVFIFVNTLLHHRFTTAATSSGTISHVSRMYATSHRLSSRWFNRGNKGRRLGRIVNAGIDPRNNVVFNLSKGPPSCQWQNQPRSTNHRYQSSSIMTSPLANVCLFASFYRNYFEPRRGQDNADQHARIYRRINRSFPVCRPSFRPFTPSSPLECRSHDRAFFNEPRLKQRHSPSGIVPDRARRHR